MLYSTITSSIFWCLNYIATSLASEKLLPSGALTSTMTADINSSVSGMFPTCERFVRYFILCCHRIIFSKSATRLTCRKSKVLIRIESRSLIIASWPTTQSKKTGSSSGGSAARVGRGRQSNACVLTQQPAPQQLKQGKLAHLALSSCLSSVRFTDLRSGFVPWPQLHHGSRTMLLISALRLRGCRLLSRKHLAPQK